MAGVVATAAFNSARTGSAGLVVVVSAAVATLCYPSLARLPFRVAFFRDFVWLAHRRGSVVEGGVSLFPSG